MNVQHLTRPLVVAALLSLTACATGSSAQDPFDGDRGMQQIRIEVMNLNWSDATLYALRAGERHRLGIVSGKGEAEYVLDWPTSMMLQIEINLLASESCITRGQQVDPGDRILLQIDSELRMSPECQRRR